jgi:prevent-host-death family protein
MKTMAVTEFKAHALSVLGKVAVTHEPVLVTKRGKPLAEVVPVTEQKAKAGTLADALIYEGDLVSPLGDEMWEATQ